MDSIFPNVQETEVSMGAVSWPSRKFQSWSRSGYNTEEALPKRRDLFSSNKIF